MTYESLLVERSGAVRVVSIDRQHAGNSISLETAHELSAFFRGLTGDTEARAVVITGTGDKFFCAGGDVKAYRSLESAEDARSMSLEILAVMRQIETSRCIVIAAINGYALGGGCELALSCDLRVAGPSAKLSLPQVKLGVIPAWGAWRRLAETVGRARAIELLVTGRTVLASEARHIGLINVFAEGEPVRDAAVRLASEIAQASPDAIAANKRLIREALDLPTAAGDELAAQLFGELWVSDAHRKAEAAFSERDTGEGTAR
ncbi:MAG: enoyl-CoA hydratase-related protein [Candidatus Velthaea sp.]